MILKTTDDVEIKETPAAIGALVKCGNKLIMLKRDNIPEIPDPGKIGLVGGGIESGELKNEALIREIKEEIGIEIDEKQITNLGLIKDRSENNQVKNIALVKITKEQEINIQKGIEGEKIEFFTPTYLPREEDIVPYLKGIFIKNRESLKRWLQGEEIKASELGLENYQ